MNSYPSFFKYPEFNWEVIDQQQKLIYQSLSEAQQNCQYKNLESNWEVC